MVKHSTVISGILLGLSLASSAHALEFQPLGAGSLGVGGAGVARNYGAMAPYWNPAGLAFAPKTVTVSLTAGVGLQPEGNLTKNLDDLSKTYDDWDKDQTNIAKTTALANAFNSLIDTTSADNLHVTAGAAVGAQVKHVGFGVYGTFEGISAPNPGGTPLPTDPATLATLTPTQITNALSTKTVNIRGIALLEVPLSYGYNVDMGSAGNLGIGATGKYIYGEATSIPNEQVFSSGSNSIVSSKDLGKDLRENSQGSSSYGIDLGVLWKPFTSTAVGVVAKNLNAPSFKTGSGDKIVADRQVRAGVSVDALSWLELTADIDVLPNKTVLPGIKTQHLGGGAEFHPISCLKLRVGGYTDLAASSSKGAVTAGLSLGIPWVYFDIDGAYGLGTVRYDNTNYPSEAKVQFSTNFAF